jgi:RNA polymerase sigma-70 factor (ECF subfamily)
MSSATAYAEPADPAVADVTPPGPAAATSDAELVRRLKAGDEAAYETVVRTLGGRLLAVARRFLQDEDLAKDAVQDALLSAFRSIQGFDGGAQLSTWLHRIVVNAALMRLRTRRRKPELPIEPLLPAFADDGHHARPVVPWVEGVEHQLIRDETRARVRQAIAELPESYRTVLLLRDIEERSTREAADLVGISENALKLRLHRARQALATRLRDTMGAPAAAGRIDARRCPSSARDA